MGWSSGTGRSHVARLTRQGWIARVGRPLGKGSLFFATRLGVRVAGVDVPPAPPPAPIWWDHHDACAWVAAWLTVRDRGLVGPRELIADETWQVWTMICLPSARPDIQPSAITAPARRYRWDPPSSGHSLYWP